MEFATFISPGEKVLLNRILQIVQHYTNLQKFIYDNISVGSVEASCAGITFDLIKIFVFIANIAKFNITIF